MGKLPSSRRMRPTPVEVCGNWSHRSFVSMVRAITGAEGWRHHTRSLAVPVTHAGGKLARRSHACTATGRHAPYRVWSTTRPPWKRGSASRRHAQRSHPHADRSGRVPGSWFDRPRPAPRLSTVTRTLAARPSTLPRSPHKVGNASALDTGQTPERAPLNYLTGPRYRVLRYRPPYTYYIGTYRANR